MKGVSVKLNFIIYDHLALEETDADTKVVLLPATIFSM